MKQLGSRTRARIAINKLVCVAGIDRKGHSHRAVGSSSATFFTPPQAGFTCGCSKGGGCGGERLRPALQLSGSPASRVSPVWWGITKCLVEGLEIIICSARSVLVRAEQGGCPADCWGALCSEQGRFNAL